MERYLRLLMENNEKLRLLKKKIMKNQSKIMKTTKIMKTQKNFEYWLE